MKRILIVLLITMGFNAFSQSKSDSTKLKIGAYIDTYYSWYSNNDDVRRQEHDFVGVYHNNFGLNIAQFNMQYEANRFRGAATVHFGDIPNYTWNDPLRPIQEAYGGLRLLNNLWFDVGFFPSHVGTESFLPKENPLSIGLLATYYGPFYQSGARISFEPASNWLIQGYVINGYNLHIDNNNQKSFGLLVKKKWNEQVQIGYSSLLGEEAVGLPSSNGFLVYQNLYASVDKPKWLLSSGVDFANSLNGSLQPNWLYAAMLTFKYRWNKNFATTVRGELFSDESGINSFETYFSEDSNMPSQLNAMFQGTTVAGATLGIEYAQSEYGFIRLESRYLTETKGVRPDELTDFTLTTSVVNPIIGNRTQVLLTVGVYFDKTFKFAR
jgi:hypothetical protein